MLNIFSKLIITMRSKRSTTRSSGKNLVLGLNVDTSTPEKLMNSWISASIMSTALSDGCALGKRIGTASAAGQLFEHPTHKNRVIKVIYGPLNGKNGRETLQGVRKEFAMGELIHSLGIGGRFYKLNMCGPNAHMTMQRFEGTLSEFIENPRKFGVTKRHLNAAALQIKRLVQKLHRHGLYHGDIHLNNFMFNRTPTGFKWYLIDFGFVHTKNRPINRVSRMDQQSQYAMRGPLMVSDFLRYIARSKLGGDAHESLGHWGPPTFG